MDSSLHPSVFIPTKLHPPRSLADVIPRPRLTEALNGVLERKMALVLAPAGYGKSTLVASWLASAPAPGAWLSLDVGDNTLTGFLHYLVAAIQTIHPEAGQELLALLRSPEAPPIEVLAASLIRDLARIQQDYVLVLDDYYFIKQLVIHDFMDHLIRFAPPTLHLIIISRVVPPLSVHRLRMNGQLVEIRIHELRFTPEEVLDFMRSVWSDSFDAQLATLLWQKSEGWAAGLRMYTLSVRRAEELAAVIEHIPSQEIALEYLYHEVFEHQPEPVQQCLLVTAVVDRFSVELCDYLCEALCELEGEPGRLDGQGFVTWLEKSGVFAVPLDDRREWYRYHHLFQDLLRQQLVQARGPDFLARVHRRASDWFAQQGLLEEAITHALAADDVERAADIIEQNKDPLLNTDQWGVLEKWLSWLPEEIIDQRRGLLLAQMWIAQFQYDFPRAVHYLSRLEALLSPDETTEPTMAGEIAFFRGLPLFWSGQVAESAPFFQQAMDLLPPANELPRATAELYVGVAWQFTGREKETVAYFDNLLTQVHQDGIRKSRILAVIFITYLIHGELTQGYRYAKKLSAMANGRDQFATAWSHYTLGNIHLSWNETEEAINHFRQAVELRYFLDSNTAVDSFAGLALAHQRQGRSDLANQAADRLLAFIREQDHLAELWDTWGHSLQVRLAILQQDEEKALIHSRAADFNADRMTPLFWLELPRLTQARLLMFMGTEQSLKKAADLLETHLQDMRKIHNVRQQIEILPLLAVTYQRQGWMDLAMQRLIEGVALAENGSIFYPFLELGQEMRWLLKALNESHNALPHRDFIRQLLDAYPSQKDDRRPMMQASLPEPLTRREMEVLALIARRYSNREIAEALFISETTVKRHVSNILAKLQARRRQDAVQKAYALGVLG